MDIGHPACNRYAMTLVIAGVVHDLYDDSRFVAELLDRTKDLRFDRTDRRAALATLTDWLIANPDFVWQSRHWLGAKARHMVRAFLRARGRVEKLSFFIHDFMGACALDATVSPGAALWWRPPMARCRCACTTPSARRW